MLEHLPAWIGKLLRDRRAGHEKLVVAGAELGPGAQRLGLSSPAFADGSRLPVRFTADGEGVSPPLAWTGVPTGTACLCLIVEDPDAPTAQPLVHAIVADLPPGEHSLSEGAVAAGDAAPDGQIGRNSFLRRGWLPPDPPTGHGEHDYVFQLFALSQTCQLDEGFGRDDFVRAISGRVLAVGVLTGTYSRGETIVRSGEIGVARI